MERRDRFAAQNRPERNPAERLGRDVLARRANRDAKRNAAVRPHGRMRDGPKGRSPLRHAKPSRRGSKALAEVDVQGLRFSRLLKNSAVGTTLPKWGGFSGSLVELSKNDGGPHRSRQRERLLKIVFQQPVRLYGLLLQACDVIGQKPVIRCKCEALFSTL